MSAANADEEQSSSKFDISVGQFLGNKEMYLVIVIFVITAIVVYLVRRMEVDNAWTLAIISGALIQVAGLFVGYIVLGVTGKTLWLIVGNIISLLIAFILQFLFMNLDYARTERVQFEDDDYYYYVKAVPKLTVSAPDVKVQRIYSRKNVRREKNETRE